MMGTTGRHDKRHEKTLQKDVTKNRRVRLSATSFRDACRDVRLCPSCLNEALSAQPSAEGARRRCVCSDGRLRPRFGRAAERRLHRDRRRRGGDRWARKPGARGAAWPPVPRPCRRDPIRWLVLTHHHPDHHFGAVVLRRAGARVIAHPDVSTGVDEQSREAAESAWTLVVGKAQMVGFAYADLPDRAIVTIDTLRLGGKTIVISHAWRGAAHTAGDLIVGLPAERVLFAGDLLIEDGVTMVVDGSGKGLLAALDTLAALAPRIAVPSHGAIPADPQALIGRTRDYMLRLRAAMRGAIERHRSLNRALDSLPPAD